MATAIEPQREILTAHGVKMPGKLPRGVKARFFWVGRTNDEVQARLYLPGHKTPYWEHTADAIEKAVVRATNAAQLDPYTFTKEIEEIAA